MAILGRDLIKVIRQQFPLAWNSLHGAPHWARVRENGLRLAPLTGANPRVVELFAFLHDSRRGNNDDDPGHGPRAALFAETLSQMGLVELSPEELEDLVTACRFHSEGQRKGSPTILTCWDADRLDLGRVGKKPLPHLLCTDAARESAFLEWAYERSVGKPRSWISRAGPLSGSPMDLGLTRKVLKVRFS
jgi:uncharacterized protein